MRFRLYPFATLLPALGLALFIRTASAQVPPPPTGADVPVVGQTSATNAAGWTGPKLLPDDAETAWKIVLSSQVPPKPPADWNGRTVTSEERAAHKASMGEAAARGADISKEFYTRFPNHPNAVSAKQFQHDLLAAAVQLGISGRRPEYEALAKDVADAAPPASPQPQNEPSPENEAFQAKFKPVFEKVAVLIATNKMEAFQFYAAELKKLFKEYPSHPQILVGFVECGSFLPAEESGELVKIALRHPNTPMEHRMQASAILGKQRIGTSVDIRFKALDGREVDLAAMKGKVVMVDFWATWCAPCRRVLPSLKQAYANLHEKGFDIIGISSDDDRQTLQTFLKQEGVAWPQYFEESGNNRFFQQFDVVPIPTMWLIDKKGVIRHVELEGELQATVEKLLAET